MSNTLPPLNPDKSASGIAVDPRTLERVIPESRRADGSVRKTLKIRPGFTPQEDVSRFRGSRQQTMDKNTLPKGHILGWVAPSAATNSKPKTQNGGESGGADTTKGKNTKKKAKKQADKEALIKACWEDDDDEKPVKKPSSKAVKNEGKDDDAGAETLTEDLKKLELK